ncbi:kunitz-type serine protease inhibitor PIVL-like [Gigantopelta aegis]|uniref:kunitz-type serine protease inhibitor PIVL-like n=1 Tax=Gigantopelta aegis TaxID=1735272 RepID=UPI001B88A7BB|nr:kunitz-type serine protease inhibitor PIVL-like [Gigantopelta aegis]
MKMLIVLVLMLAVGSSMQDDPRCKLPKDDGDCGDTMHYNAHLRWYYDAASNSCEVFEFFGCGGNENRFADSLDCVLRCIKN